MVEALLVSATLQFEEGAAPASLVPLLVVSDQKLRSVVRSARASRKPTEVLSLFGALLIKTDRNLRSLRIIIAKSLPEERTLRLLRLGG